MTSELHIKRLRTAVEKAVGRRMRTSKDFDFLSKQLFERLHQQVSVSTLKRLWGYVATDSQPRESTLDLLAQFVGSANWEVFCAESDPPHTQPQEDERRPAMKSRWVVAVVAVFVVVAGLAFILRQQGTASELTIESVADTSSVIRIGAHFDAPQEYLRRFNIIADSYLWGQIVPGHPDISVWGPQYHHPEWHNEGDSARMLPTITEWWEPPTVIDPAFVATRNLDRYLQYRRMNELRITFMKDLVDTGYVFLGVYRLSMSQSDTARCVWQRVADEVNLHDIDALERLR